MPHALFHVRPSFPLFHGLTFTREIALSNDPFVPSLRRCSLLSSFFLSLFFFFLVFLRDSSAAAAATFSKVKVRLAFRDWKKATTGRDKAWTEREKEEKGEITRCAALFDF